MSLRMCAKCTKSSLAGNRTQVFCVTDRDTHHYTTKDHLFLDPIITYNVGMHI